MASTVEKLTAPKFFTLVAAVIAAVLGLVSYFKADDAQETAQAVQTTVSDSLVIPVSGTVVSGTVVSPTSR